MFSISQFAEEDKPLIINENLNMVEKETWTAGYLWWPINEEWVDRYMAEKGLVGLYNLHFNDEKVGNFSIWLDDKCEEGTVRVTRIMVYRQHIHRMFNGKRFSWWAIDEAVKEAKRLYPDKTPYAIVWDFSKNETRGMKAPLLSTGLAYGFEETKRIQHKSKDFIIGEKIWLKLKEN